MNVLIRCLLVFCLVVPYQGIQAQILNKKSPIKYATSAKSYSDYILSVNEIKQLNYVDRIYYFQFLYYYTTMLKLTIDEQRRAGIYAGFTKEEKQNTDRLYSLLEKFKNMMLPEAEAIAPLIWLGVNIVGGAAMSVAENWENIQDSDSPVTDFLGSVAIGAGLGAIPGGFGAKLLARAKPLKAAVDKAVAAKEKVEKRTDPSLSRPRKKAQARQKKYEREKERQRGLERNKASGQTQAQAKPAADKPKASPSTGDSNWFRTAAASLGLFGLFGLSGDNGASDGRMGDTISGPASDLKPDKQAEGTENDPPVSPEVVEEKPEPAKREGTCIYAGYISEYETSKGMKNLCKKPKMSKCSDKKQVACNDLGLQFKKDSLCVDKRPVKDLTKRCADRFAGVISQQGVGYLDVEKYDEWSKKLIDAVKAFENNKMDDNKTFKQYCADKDKPEFRQKIECEALNQMTGELRDMVPRIRGLVEYRIQKAIDDEKARIAALKSACVSTEEKAKSCMQCGIMGQFGDNAPPSDHYIKLLEVMAVQCEGENAPDFAKKNLAIQNRVAQYVSTLGYCSDFRGGSETEDFMEESYDDLMSGKKSLAEKSVQRSFEKTFGMDVETAKSSFCAAEDDTDFYKEPYKMQQQFNKGMHANRQTKRKYREKSGWMNCDTQIQLVQNRPMVHGVTERHARSYTSHYSKKAEEDGKDVDYRTKNPLGGSLSWNRQSNPKKIWHLRMWNPHRSGATDKDGNNQAAEDFFSLVNYPAKGKKKFTESDISELIGQRKMTPNKENIAKSKALQDDLLFACGGPAPQHLIDSTKPASKKSAQ